MKDVYVNMFYELLSETKDSSGLGLPEDLESYVVYLLADNIKKPDFLPQNSFAETYLQIGNLHGKKGAASSKQLADCCLFLTGVFPDYGSRKGLSIEYFTAIGQGSYSRAAQDMNADLFIELSKYFHYARKIINYTVNKSNIVDLTNL